MWKDITVSMGKMNLSNLKKTVYYFKRNGIKGTCFAVLERLTGRGEKYEFLPVSGDELQEQRQKADTLSDLVISIVVPTYHTPKEFLVQLLQSVQAQSYPKWELILADASQDDCVEGIVSAVADDRIKYFALPGNGGISENTNQGILRATGDYIGLLDHDDILTPNALYEVVSAIEKKRAAGITLQLIYTDEDKCDSTAGNFYEPHFKTDFNADLLFSNNYICHFMVMKRELLQELKLRGSFDGAQDFDLMLRAVDRLYGQWEKVAHVPKVLYHWRCHAASTAENPASKMYAYDAGRRAVQEFANHRGWSVRVADTKHLGFYWMHYDRPIFDMRPEVGAIGFPVMKAGRIVGGAMNSEGEPLYYGLPGFYSGYMHRASLQQNVDCLDIGRIKVRPQLQYLFQELFHVPYITSPETDCFDVESLPANTDLQKASIQLAKAIREQGFLLLYLPE